TGPSGGGAGDRRYPDDTVLAKEELHASLSSPALKGMTFLNEISARYRAAISFAAGRPYEEFFDTDEVFAALHRYVGYLTERGATPQQVRRTLCQYGTTAGEIRELVAESLRADEGILAEPGSVVVTVGCQEAMLLVLRALFTGGDDVLLVSSPCYLGITGAARMLDVPVTAVPEGDQGLSADALAAAIRSERSRGRRPRACYVAPDHANPSGNTIPRSQRRALLDLAARERVLLLEDSPYRLVSAGRREPALKALDHHRSVILLGSFAKTVFPGARVGYLVADQRVRDATGQTGLLAGELTKLKSIVTVNTSPLSQAVVAGVLLGSGGGLATRAARAAAHYRDGLATLRRELERHFPARRRDRLAVDWNRPEGGFFLSLRVPFRADDAALARCASDHGVIWTPMSYFHPRGGGDDVMRLSCSNLTRPEIEEGVARLARFITDEMRHGQRAAGKGADT
ncbi:MAG: PLP-dependent aminotransferase family protein, partial [Natronosporangium sp.]